MMMKLQIFGAEKCKKIKEKHNNQFENIHLIPFILNCDRYHILITFCNVIIVVDVANTFLFINANAAMRDQ